MSSPAPQRSSLSFSSCSSDPPDPPDPPGLRQNWNLTVNCIMRMLFAWLLIWPNDELPKLELAGAAHCTMFNRLRTSMLIDAEVPPLVRTLLRMPRSTLSRHGDSTPGSIRGALPNWF